MSTLSHVTIIYQQKFMYFLMVFDIVVECTFFTPAPQSTPHPAQHCNKSLVCCCAPHDAVILIINGNIQFVHPPTIIYFSVRRSGALKGYNIRGGPESAARPAATPGHPAAALYSRHPPLDPAEILTKLSQIYLEYFMHNCCERAFPPP